MQKFFHEKLEDSIISLANLDKKTFYEKVADKYGFKEQNILTDEDYFNNPKTSFIYLLYFLYKNQNKVFLIEDDLTESLCNTDVKVKMKDILPPFRIFIIYLNNSTFMIHDVVNGLPHEIPLKYIFVEIFKFHNENKKEFLCLRFFTGYSIGDENDLDNWYNTGFNENIIAYHDELELFYNHESPLTNLKDRNNDKETSKSIDKVANFIITFILYYNLSQKELEIIKPHSGFSRINILKDVKRKRILERMLQNETRQSVYYLGRKYKIKYESNGNGTGKKIDYKILVRGHFRHQWYGSKVDEKGNERLGEYQKVVWIEPFFKGTDLEDKNGRTLYVAKKD